MLSLLFILSLILNYGCVEFLTAAALTGTGELARYTMRRSVHRTFSKSRQQVTEAAANALHKMGIQIKNIVSNNKETKIYAFIKNISIKIKLGCITTHTTKVSVNASKNKVINDKALANEVVAQMHALLSEEDKPGDRQKTDHKKIQIIKI